MAVELVVSPEVEFDLAEAYLWYERQRVGLGERFPYAIYYEYFDATVTVYAVFHTSRDPEKWRQRLM
jgi:hypothetical protein